MQPTKWNTRTNLSQKVCLIVSCDISTNVLRAQSLNLSLGTLVLPDVNF